MSRVKFCKNEGSQKTAWDAAFNIDGLRKRRTFGRQIDTDGVSMTVHFQMFADKIVRTTFDMVNDDKSRKRC
eukprot:evm.model.NODE_26927_length_13246_cov_23.308773.2